MVGKWSHTMTYGSQKAKYANNTMLTRNATMPMLNQSLHAAITQRIHLTSAPHALPRGERWHAQGAAAPSVMMARLSSCLTGRLWVTPAPHEQSPGTLTTKCCHLPRVPPRTLTEPAPHRPVRPCHCPCSPEQRSKRQPCRQARQWRKDRRSHLLD